MNKTFSFGSNITASRGQRFANYIIDLIVLYILIALLVMLITFITLSMDSYGFSQWMENSGDLEGYLIFALVMLPYYIIMETFTSRSLAKYITGTIVVMEDGSKPDLEAIAKRSFSRLIPFDHFSFLGSDARGWHDSIAKTYVVKTAAFNLEKKLFDELDEIGVEQSYQSQIHLK